MNGGDDPVADVHDETAAAQEANCPEPKPEIDCYRNVIALREAHDAAAAALCEGLMAWHEAVYGHHSDFRGAQRAYQSGRSDGRSEMARKCINAIDEQLQALKLGTLAHRALSALRRDMMRHVLPL